MDDADEVLLSAGAEFTEEVFDTAGDPGWQKMGSTGPDRSVAVTAAPGCQNVTAGRLITHLGLTCPNGVDQQELTPPQVLLTAHVGQPPTSVAMETFHR